MIPTDGQQQGTRLWVARRRSRRSEVLAKLVLLLISNPSSLLASADASLNAQLGRLTIVCAFCGSMGSSCPAGSGLGSGKGGKRPGIDGWASRRHPDHQDKHHSTHATLGRHTASIEVQYSTHSVRSTVGSILLARFFQRGGDRQTDSQPASQSQFGRMPNTPSRGWFTPKGISAVGGNVGDEKGGGSQKGKKTIKHGSGCHHTDHRQ